MTLLSFSKEEIQTLREIARNWRSGRPHLGGRSTFPPSLPTTQCYIALVPAAGIPALTYGQGPLGTGTGSGTIAGTGTFEQDVPGSALCDLWQIVPDDDSNFYQLVPITTQKERVFNLTTSKITQQWVTIVRDKFGSWIAQVSGSGSGAACTPQNAIHHITVIGSPESGTFSLSYTINGTLDTLTFNYNDNKDEVETEMRTHPEIDPETGTGSVDIKVTAGPFPDATIQIEFQNGLANQDIALPTADWTSLNVGTGSDTNNGIAVISSYAQLGISG